MPAAAQPPNLRKRRRRVVNVQEEDAENIPILTETQIESLNVELSPNGQARKILGELQLRIQELTQEQRELKSELATRKKARTRSHRVLKRDEEDFDVADAARFFAVNRWAFIPNLTWMGEDIETIPDDEADMQSHQVPKKKFVQDYIAILPAAVKEGYREEDIRSIFMTEMGAFRATKVHEVKQNAYKIWDHELATHISKSHSPGNTIECQRAQDLLGFQPRDPNKPPNPDDPESMDTYSIQPPFIFREGDGAQTERLFRVEALAKVLRVILFGPSSLNGLAVANNTTYGKMWGLSSVTAPMIAYAAVMVNYLLSNDREFTPTGKNSNMEYGLRYVRFRSWASALSTITAGRETLKFWNDIVFAGYTVDNGLNAIERSDGDDLSQALKVAAQAEAVLNTAQSQDLAAAGGTQNLSETPNTAALDASRGNQVAEHSSSGSA